MTQMNLKVGLKDRGYQISIGYDLIDRAGELLGEIAINRHTVIICDDKVAPLYLKRLYDGLSPLGNKLNHVIVKSGEASKSMACLTKLLNDTIEIGVDRSSLIIAFGGGVIGDLVGFAAASLFRGVDFVQIPTSLLAQVDSSVGGKTGVNAKAGKNLIGAFYQPKAVLIDTSLLKTLPSRELRAGYAEIVKYGLMGDALFFDWLEAHSGRVLDLNPEDLQHAIFTSCNIKANIVAEDEREKGKRALLNLGHTFGHAFEAVTKYDGSLLHGEAIAAGMGLAFDLSVELGICNQHDAQRCKTHLSHVGLPFGQDSLPAGNAPTNVLLSHMKHDKKTQNGVLHFILVKAIGEAFVHGDVPEQTLVQILERGFNAI